MRCWLREGRLWHRHKKACVAVARKLTVIMHAMWRDGSEFRFKSEVAEGAAKGQCDEARCYGGVTGRDQCDECAARTDRQLRNPRERRWF